MIEVHCSRSTTHSIFIVLIACLIQTVIVNNNGIQLCRVNLYCRPEFVNRLDEFIVFEPLIRSQIRDIVGLRASALVNRVAAQHIRLQLGDSALDFLAAKVCHGLLQPTIDPLETIALHFLNVYSVALHTGWVCVIC